MTAADTPLADDRRRGFRAVHAAWIVLALLVLGGAFYLFDVPTAALILVGACVALTALRQFESAFALLFILSSGVSFDLLLRLRPENTGTVPINVLDVATALLAISVLLNLLDRREGTGLPAYLRRSYFSFLAMTLFGVGYGLFANSGSMYTFLKDARLFFTLHLVILSVARFIRTARQLRFLAMLVVATGVVCAAQQLGDLATGFGHGFGGIRDVTLPTPVIPMAVLFLVFYRYHGLSLVPRNSHPFIVSGLLLALLVSFTRGAWLAMVFGYLISMAYIGSKARARAILTAAVALGAIVFVVPFALDLWNHGMDLQGLVTSRIQSLVDQNDPSTQYRLINIADAWLDYLKSPIWGHGIGHPIYVFQVELGGIAEAELLHNSVLYYAIKIGALGFAAWAWMIFAALRRAARVAAAPAETPDGIEAQAFAKSLVASMVPFVIIGPWSGNLNFVGFMPLLGLAVGLNWDSVVRAAAASGAAARSAALEPTLH